MILHVVVSSTILALALAAARWIRPLTARTRHAILVAGMASLLIPSTLVTSAIERSGTKVMMPLRSAMPAIVHAPAAAPPPASLPWRAMATALWLVVAAALFLRSLLLTHRLVTNVKRAGTAPPERAVAALDAARRRLSLRTSIDLIATPLCEAPAVIRVLRPIIVLPSDGCRSLDDEELESLLCHECAHVARRDNLVGLFEAVAGAVFWFNPLVWLARRRVASAREEACDERVADAAMPAETYAGALAKLCSTLIAPRVAAVSCMASTHLKERIEHLMRYDTLRPSALSHRFITVASTAAVLALILTGGIVAAAPGPDAATDPFLFNVSVSRGNDDTFMIVTDVVDSTTQERVGATTIHARPNVPAASEITSGDKRWRIEAAVRPSGDGTLTFVAWVNGAEVQRTARIFAARAAQPGTARKMYNGEPISMNLRDADLRDVLKTFGALTGLEITVAPEVQGLVNVNFTNVPWDQALDQILRENGLAFRLEGKKMQVFRSIS
jgi:beta-lactamase regulating signal transducer with metallopeptidase domain